jgi:FkbM family methyltransferase
MDYRVLADAADHLPSEPVIVEAGANTGEWTEEALNRLGPCALIAFEPQAAAYRHLSERLSMYEEVTTFMLAAGATEDRGELSCSHDHLDVRATLHRRPDVTRRERVNVRPIDAVLDEYNVPRIDFLKIDTEGYELEVLRGAERYLKTGIRLIQFEYNDMARTAGVRWQWIHVYLTDLGYRIYQVADGWPEMPPTEPDAIDADYVARRG